ncbi:Uncharacterized protein TCM_021373 [Theobroma cacao]|uniref:Uncharacterized protein n=1 Tax=Theobroma cacao TaxID=3641 RepID=A0A061EPG9_THECC|nr:Uncharacterized protein TCM_021373 [Theobroma cacao]
MLDRDNLQQQQQKSLILLPFGTLNRSTIFHDRWKESSDSYIPVKKRVYQQKDKPPLQALGCHASLS